MVFIPTSRLSRLKPKRYSHPNRPQKKRVSHPLRRIPNSCPDRSPVLRSKTAPHSGHAMPTSASGSSSTPALTSSTFPSPFKSFTLPLICATPGDKKKTWSVRSSTRAQNSPGQEGPRRRGGVVSSSRRAIVLAVFPRLCRCFAFFVGGEEVFQRALWQHR